MSEQESTANTGDVEPQEADGVREEIEHWWASTDAFEFWATVLIALAAVLTAWAGFESAKWGGVQATNFSQAGAARTESVRYSTLAGQQTSIDVMTYINWLNNYVDDVDSGEIEPVQPGEVYEPTPGTPSGFYFERFRPEFVPAVHAWLATMPLANPDAPATPFEMEEYQLAATGEARLLEERADQKAADAATANQNSDNYVMTAVLFATALFFAALASRLSAPRYRYASLTVATLLLAGTVIYVMTLPIEL